MSPTQLHPPIEEKIPSSGTVSDSPRHRRKSSLEVDPYEPSDLYYSAATDPSNKSSKFSRFRTRSVVAPKRSHRLQSFTLNPELLGIHDKNNQFGLFSSHTEGSNTKDSKFSHGLTLQQLKSLNLSTSGTNTPVISDSDDDDDDGINSDLESDVENDEESLTKSHSTGSLIADVDQRVANYQIEMSSPNVTSEELNENLKDIPNDADLMREVTGLEDPFDDDDDNNNNNNNNKKNKNKNKKKNKNKNKNDNNESNNDNDNENQTKAKTNKVKPSTTNLEIPFPSSSPMNKLKDGNVKKILPEKHLFPSPSTPTVRRRGSADLSSSLSNSKRFFISDIDATLKELLRNEDTDKDCQITIDDTGPKVLKLGTANSGGFRQYDIRGTYMLSNLLQELTIAKRFGRKQMILDEARLNENPVSRLHRLITTSFWKNLTRKVDEDSILEMAQDTKIRSKEAKYPRIYVPYDEEEQYYYYSKIAKKNKDYKLDVVYLPKDITADYVESINNIPGLLALAVRRKSDTFGDLEGYPYVVPGGRFNEQYGWDSYFETLGLLASDYLEPCIGMCENFIFEINHYGKILNANRSYYLCRSQPPFLTDMALRIFNYIKEKQGREDLSLLKRAFMAAIKEYNEVWCSPPRLDPFTGLSTYHPDGKGIPPETEESHFHAVLQPFVEKYKLTYKEFETRYNKGLIKEPDLDEYFLHDRAVRESGHDTSYRLEGVCANLATVDLNSLLYKYEVDIAFVIKTYFNNELTLPDGTIETSEKWIALAEKRKELIETYMWNEKESLYFDYNIKKQKQSRYESVTAFYTLWAGLCSKERAEVMIRNSLYKFEEFGGLVSGTKKSRGELGIDKPVRQWDYPFAWAPHQMLVWEGLKRYGKKNIAQRLSYRWLYLMTLAFVDFNGIVVEKYDATSERQPHKVEAEYGNQGAGFKGVATEGFGWVNASFIVGLQNLDTLGKRALGLVTSPNDFFEKMSATEKEKYGLRL